MRDWIGKKQKHPVSSLSSKMRGSGRLDFRKKRYTQETHV